MPESLTSRPTLATLDALRAQLRGIVERDCTVAARLPFGVPEIDDRLDGGGLAVAALHEFAGDGGMAGEVIAGLFAAGIAARAGAGQVLWVLGRRDLFAPGIAQAGLPPDRVLYAEAGNDSDILAVMEDALGAGVGLSAVVGEVKRIGTAATRRLQLAAGEGGTTALVLRRTRASVDPFAEPSAAVTRWRLGPAPSTPLPVPGVGRACWDVTLARQRGGPGHQWIMEACDETGRLALPADPVHRQDQASGARARAA